VDTLKRELQQRGNMPLLTELEYFLGCDFYKYVTPDGAGPFSARCTASRSNRFEFLWTNFFVGRKVKIVNLKSHTPVPRAKPAATPAK
jgi:hypothetical protein